jgi:hypothetical protein
MGNEELSQNAVGGSITFSKHGINGRYRSCRSILKFFEGEICFIENEDSIVFKKPSIDDNNYVKTTLQKGWYRFNIKCNAPLGTYKIDKEDSTEDELVLYYR